MKKYIVRLDDPFYDNRCTFNRITDNFIVRVTQLFDRTDLSNIKNLGYALSKYNLDTDEFTPYSFLKEVDISVFKQLPSSFFESDKFLFDSMGVCKNILVNIETMQYAYSSEFPHSVYWIDGNIILEHIHRGMCLTFYALTYDYESGLFVYNPKTDSFNNDQIIPLGDATKSNYKDHCPIDDSDDEDDEDCEEWNYEPEDFTNKYINLHKKIVGCCCDVENRLYIIYAIEYDGISTNYLGLYNPFTDDLSTLGVYKQDINGLCYDGKDVLLITNNGIIRHDYITHNEIYTKFEETEGIKPIMYSWVYKDRLVIISVDYRDGIRGEIIYQIPL